MVKEKILVVDDEEDILELISYTLKKQGFQVQGAITGEEAVHMARTISPDLICLDLMLPGIDGLDVCRLLKADPQTTSIPILMVTAKGTETDIVTGLDLGADDYVTKPFSPKILVARAKAILRRQGRSPDDDTASFRIGEVEIHPGRHEVLVKGRPVELTLSEFKLLSYLFKKPGWVFTRNQIIDEVHGIGYAVTDRSVDVLVVGLRKKIGACGELIETVRGIGYRVKESG